uniref:Uncharacterized protein n=1 Tax=Setaria viridis TaxID=4556 RepID=A0A4U6U9Z6_SETVI|nr:LOW QUALITY PROTEIN: hypothetical protein SEVIR_6G152300v2 [Setaria viridis]
MVKEKELPDVAAMPQSSSSHARRGGISRSSSSSAASAANIPSPPPSRPNPAPNPEAEPSSSSVPSVAVAEPLCRRRARAREKKRPRERALALAAFLARRALAGKRPRPSTIPHLQVRGARVSPWRGGVECSVEASSSHGRPGPGLFLLFPAGAGRWRRQSMASANYRVLLELRDIPTTDAAAARAVAWRMDDPDTAKSESDTGGNARVGVRVIRRSIMAQPDTDTHERSHAVVIDVADDEPPRCCCVCTDPLDWVAVGSIRFFGGDRRFCVCRTRCPTVLVTRAAAAATDGASRQRGFYYYHAGTGPRFNDRRQYRKAVKMCVKPSCPALAANNKPQMICVDT